MNNLQSKCITCSKQYTKKTLEKYRGLYCKPCFYEILIKENIDLKKALSDQLVDTNGKYTKILYENSIYIRGHLNNGINLTTHEGLIKIYRKGGILLYNGGWKNRKQHGEGKQYREDGSIEYDGEWKNGKSDGNGKSYGEGGHVMYDGEWLDGKIHGKGKSYFKPVYSGRLGQLQYDGEYKFGKYHGKGIYTWKPLNCWKYEGEWVEGDRHGYGVLYQDGSIVQDGIWEKDKFSHEKIEEEVQCIICYTKKKCYAFIPCGHLCMCEDCHEKYQDDKCIICRREFSISYKIFN